MQRAVNKSKFNEITEAEAELSQRFTWADLALAAYSATSTGVGHDFLFAEIVWRRPS
jgi:hypothetical protein